jgi:hypothetical protein
MVASHIEKHRQIYVQTYLCVVSAASFNSGDTVYQQQDLTTDLRMQQNPTRDWTARRSRRVIPDTATDDTTIGSYQYSASVIISNRKHVCHSYDTRTFWHATV